MHASRPALIVRVDASLAVATGHVMRCLALAQAWQDTGGHAIFAMAESTPAIEGRLGWEGIDVIRLAVLAGRAADAASVADLALRCDAAWVVVDGYHFGSDYQHWLKNAGLKLLFIDDNGEAGHYSADLVLNQNTHATESLYRNRECYTQLLLGLSYAMLRREFLAWRRWRRAIGALGGKVLVTLGGSDLDNVTLRIIAGLEHVTVDGLEATAVVGAMNPHLADLERAAAASKYQIRLVTDATNMAELMAWADVAISGAGATCWEMCLLGLPAMLVDLAPNQLRIAQQLDRSGVSIHIGTACEVSPQMIAGELEQLLKSAETRKQMSESGRALVDGGGASRVVDVLARSQCQSDCSVMTTEMDAE